MSTDTPIDKSLTHNPGVGSGVSMLASVSLIAFFALGGALIAGVHGLAPKLEPLLLDSAFSSLLMILFGAYLALLTIAGTIATARSGEMLGQEWSSIWVPIKVVMMCSVLIPLHEGQSLFAQGMLQAVRLGASL